MYPKLHTGWFRSTQNVMVLGIALMLLILHLVSINQIPHQIYDETYYTLTAQIVLHNSGEEVPAYYFGIDSSSEVFDIVVEHYEDGFFIKRHTPLGSLFIAAGIKLFGDGPFGWRTFPVLFGVASIILFYLICQKLVNVKWVPLIATFIFAFENLNFVISGLAMLDVFSFTFMLAAFLLYLHSKYVSAGVLLALSMLAKMTGVFGFGIIILHWLITRRERKLDGAKFLVAFAGAFVILLPILIYISIGEFRYPWDTVGSMFSFHSGDTYASISDEQLSTLKTSLPWEWLLVPKSIVIWDEPKYEINPSWSLWALIIPSMCYMLYRAVQKRWDSFSLFVLLWFSGIFFSWLAIYLIWDRLMYSFYFYPAIGSVSLASGYMLSQMLSLPSVRNKPAYGWMSAIPVALFLLAHFVMFWLMAPVI